MHTLPSSTSRAQFDIWASDPERTLDVSPVALWVVADADNSGELSASEVAAFSQIAYRHRPAPNFHKVGVVVIVLAFDAAWVDVFVSISMNASPVCIICSPSEKQARLRLSKL